MADQNSKIELLLNKLEILLKRQDHFSKEIHEIQKEIYRIKEFNFNPEKVEKKPLPTLKVNPELDEVQESIPNKDKYITPHFKKLPPKKKKVNLTIKKTEIEKFIGENLINKIGILITVIGVGIGAKYSIENDLISPLTRIILGYFAGLGLLGYGIQFKMN